MTSISYKNILRIICVLCALVLAMLGGIIWNAAKASGYRALLENGIICSLKEAASGMNTLSADLKKSSYAGTPAQVTNLSAKVWKESGRIKSALDNLPSGTGGLDSTYKFLAQVGDYSMYLSRRASNGHTPSEEEHKTVEMLMEYSDLLADKLSELERRVSAGELSAADFVKARGVLPSRDLDMSGFTGMEKSFEGYPVLIYDGPFSDNLMTRKPKITEDLPRISREAAREIAGGFAGISPSELLSGGDEVSNMPLYTFCNDNITVGVTMSGGYVTYLSGSRPVDGNVLTPAQARENARGFLEKNGINSMAEVDYENSSGILTVNFAYTQDGVICYPDLIKVGVAMDNGEVLYYDARDFINNHRERELKGVALPPEAAVNSISRNLNPESYKLAIIPTPGGDEALTWEFTCAGKNNENVLVYVNTETGAEEQILILEHVGIKFFHRA